MRRLYNICVSGILSVVLLGGCQNILEEKPVGLATAESYYSTPKGIRDGLNAVYSNLRRFYGREEAFFLTVTGTDVFTNGFGGETNYPDINNYSANFLGSNAFVTTVWDNFYAGINQANAVIGRVGDVNGLSDEEKNIITGEARFLRALFYFHLV